MKIDKKYTSKEIRSFNKKAFETYQKGDIDTRNEIFEYNIGLVKIVCSFWDLSNLESTTKEDIFQYGCLGLLYAIDNYDISRGVEFSSYAISCIKGQVCNNVYETDSAVHLPLHVKTLLNKLYRIKGNLDLINNGNTPDEILCKELKITSDKLNELKKISHIILSNNNNDDEDDYPIIDYLIDDELFSKPEDVLIAKEIKEEIGDVLDDILTKRQKEILLLRNHPDSSLYDKKYSEISRKIGYSKQYICKTEQQAILKLSKNDTIKKIRNK